MRVMATTVMSDICCIAVQIRAGLGLLDNVRVWYVLGRRAEEKGFRGLRVKSRCYVGHIAVDAHVIGFGGWRVVQRLGTFCAFGSLCRVNRRGW